MHQSQIPQLHLSPRRDKRTTYKITEVTLNINLSHPGKNISCVTMFSCALALIIGNDSQFEVREEMISAASRGHASKKKMISFSPLVLLPEKGVLHTQDLDNPELGLRHSLVEEAVHRPVAAVFTCDWHLQEVLTHRHGQPCFWKKAGWVGGCWREGMRRREIHR